MASAYEMRNVSPLVEEIEITPANYKFPAPAVPGSATLTTITLPPLGKKAAASNGAANDASTPTLTFAKGQLGARWLASDENGDTLVFKLEIRGEGETGVEAIEGKYSRAVFQLGFDGVFRWQVLSARDGQRRTLESAGAGPECCARERAFSDRQFVAGD